MSSTHEFLTNQGLCILANDVGASVESIFPSDKRSTIIKGCTHPDKNETDCSTFTGHFIFWKNKTNYWGTTKPTALTRFLSNYKKALGYFRNDQNDQRWAHKLGDALHYFEDATAPFHAANDPTFLSGDFDHSKFEKKAEEWHDRYIVQKGDHNLYDLALSKSLEELLLMAAHQAYDTYIRYDLTNTENEWEQGAEEALTNAQKWVAAILFRFVTEVWYLPELDLMHTLHHEGSLDPLLKDYWEPFEDIEKNAGNIYRVDSVECANFGRRLSILALTEIRLLHTLRSQDGSCTHWGDVEQQAGDIGPIDSIACARAADNLHVLAIGENDKLWHTIRWEDGKWQQWGDVNGQTGYNGSIDSAACAYLYESGFHVLVTDYDGKLWHAIRYDTGDWSAFSRVEKYDPADRGASSYLACAFVGYPREVGELHVLASGDGGTLWHSILHQDGCWDDFRDVEQQAGDVGPIESVACAAIGSPSRLDAPVNLHVLAVDENHCLWFVIRYEDGHWGKWRDVKAATRYSEPISSVACANVNGELHVCTTSGGPIDISTKQAALERLFT
jgi:hypothetical protein